MSTMEQNTSDFDKARNLYGRLKIARLVGDSAVATEIIDPELGEVIALQVHGERLVVEEGLFAEGGDAA